jgi:XTP/dITP diphosphohydrolase
MTPEVLYATSNPGKLEEVGRYLGLHGIALLSPAQVGGEIEVPETGTTLEENAVLKAQAYAERYPQYIVMSDDTGCEIAGLNGEPGIYVRRWRDHEKHMTDQEIIDYCLERMQGLKGDDRNAQMRTVIALAEPGKEVALFDGVLTGRITETAAPLKMEGFPFEAIFHCTECNMLLGEMHQLSDSEKLKYLTQREKAVHKTIAYLMTLFSGK